MYSVQSGQAAVGVDALIALPGAPGSIIRGTFVTGGAYQTGTGIGQVIDGKYAEGGKNIALGSLAVFGGVAGVKLLINQVVELFHQKVVFGRQERLVIHLLNRRIVNRSGDEARSRHDAGEYSVSQS